MSLKITKVLSVLLTVSMMTAVLPAGAVVSTEEDSVEETAAEDVIVTSGCPAEMPDVPL